MSIVNLKIFINFSALDFDALMWYYLYERLWTLMKESGEMYLESIYRLCQEKGFVRSVDVAESMNYSKPSVSRAVGLLKKDGFIELDVDGYIVLTPAGKKKAKSIFERHTVLTDMLISLGVDRKTADEDACRMEHVISEKTFNAMKKHIREYATKKR